jgi:hypothetical protein
VNHEFRISPSNIIPTVKEMNDVHERDRECEVGRGQRTDALERAQVPIEQETGWAPDGFRNGVEKPISFCPTEVQNPNRPTCRKSLYRLCYPGRLEVVKVKVNFALEQTTKDHSGGGEVEV